MEELGNYKVILYIVLAILYFLFTGKKKPQAKKTNSPQEPSKDVQSYPTSSTASSRPVTEYKSKPLVKNSSKPILLEKENQKEMEPYTLGDVLTQFGNAKVERKKIGTPLVSKDSLETTNVKLVDYDEKLKDEETAVVEGGSSKPVFQQDEHYIAKLGHNKYSEILKDPEGAKAAFIAGEIFNRRFF